MQTIKPKARQLRDGWWQVRGLGCRFVAIDLHFAVHMWRSAVLTNQLCAKVSR